MTKYATEWRAGCTGLDTVLDALFFIWKKKDFTAKGWTLGFVKKNKFVVCVRTSCTPAPPAPPLLPPGPPSFSTLYRVEPHLRGLLHAGVTLQISHMASIGSFCIILQCDYRNQRSGRSDSKGPIRKFLSRRNKNKAGTCNPATRAVFLFSTLALFLPACLTLQLSSLRDPAAVAPSGPSGLAQDIIVWGRLRPVTWWSSDRAQVSLCALSELCARDAEAVSPRASTREQKQRLFLFFPCVGVFQWHSSSKCILLLYSHYEFFTLTLLLFFSKPNTQHYNANAKAPRSVFHFSCQHKLLAHITCHAQIR